MFRKTAAVHAVVIAVSLWGYSTANAQNTSTTTVDGRPSCAKCKIVLTPVARIGNAGDPYLLRGGSQIVVNSKSRFYSTSSDGNTIMVYDSVGKFESTVSRRGSGPGEIAQYPWLSIGPGDTLYIASGRQVMVFSPAHEWRRTFASQPFMSITVLANSRVVVLGPKQRDTSSLILPLHLLTRAGTDIERSFGAIEPISRRCSWCFLFAVGAALDGRSVWVTTPERYELNRWAIDGRLLDRVAIVRSPWFKEWNPNPAVGSPEPSSRVMEVKQDSDGLVWMRAGAPLNTGNASTSRTDGVSQGTDSFTGWASILEVYDPSKKAIIASLRLDSQDVRLLSGNLVAIRRETVSGYVYFDIARLSVSGSFLKYNPNIGG